VTVTRQSADITGIRDPLTGIIHRQGMTELSHVDICTRRVAEDSELEVNLLLHLQPMQLAEEWGDVVKLQQ